VVDDRGRGLSNVPVTFAVTSGGGTITGGSVTTNSEGVATVGSWTLGTAAGANTLTATVASLPAAQFTATGTAGAPASMVRVSGDAQSGTVGTALPQPLVVRVTDTHGNPTPGVAVTFSVTSGGGTVGTASVATDAQGLASTTYVLGRQAVGNVVTATVAGLPAVGFTLTAQAGAPAAISKAAGDNQQARSGTAVPVAPSVLVTDASGNPVSGVTVTFTVASGGGTVTGAVATTGANGRATVGSWTLGAVGTNTLTASAGAAGTVTFTATATTAGADPCTTFVPFTLRSAVNGTLATTDCRPSTGEYIDFYGTSSASAFAEEFLMTSTAVDAFLVLFDAAGNPLAYDDDGAGGNNSSIRLIAPAGQYILGASSALSGQTGAYQLSSRALPARTTCGLEAWVVPSVSFSRTLATGDCMFDDGSFYDLYALYLRAGQQVTITQRSTAFDSYLLLVDATANTVVAEDDDSAGGNDSRIVYTATRAGPFLIAANSYSGGMSGTYTLTISNTP
jgi:hypothetical protein